jgi:hypothetical protein
MLALTCAVAPLPEGQSQEISASITDRTSFDRQAVVSTAPGYNESSSYAGFENNEQVALYNGNLMVSHPSSPSFPLNGGGSFGLARVYNSQGTLDVQIQVSNLAGYDKKSPGGRFMPGLLIRASNRGPRAKKIRIRRCPRWEQQT